MQHPTPRRPRRKPGENRERLLTCGIQEFAFRGYRGASTAAIAAAAGVPQPHVYTNFHAKHDLFVSCAERVVERLITSRNDEGICEPGREENLETQTNQVLSLFIFQATAALAEVELAADLKPILAQLKAELGADAFSSLILQAVIAIT